MTNASALNRDGLSDFLTNAGWESAIRNPLAGDASTRSYERLTMGDKAALLMIAPPSAEASPCPPDADEEQRLRLGYNASARLAGPNLHAFLEVARVLRSAGIAAPEIYAADPGQGLALLEDFGDALFVRAIADGENEETLYRAAIETLARLWAAAPSPPAGDDYTMLSYDRTALLAEIALLPQWYWPLKRNEDCPADIVAEHEEIWRGLISSLTAPQVIALRDFHAENLIWRPSQTDCARVGVIDFQDALYGSPAYDLVSLLEDARRDVSEGLAKKMKALYIDLVKDLHGFEGERFYADYAILATQRNAKILGIFARLAKRDGKERYLDFMPRVEAHFRTDLSRPELEPLKAFFNRHLPELTS